jgi:glutamine amidotransferase-like uncharacterized protein
MNRVSPLSSSFANHENYLKVSALTTRTTSYQEIKKVIVYKGHENHSLFGPYFENIEKRIGMFKYLNSFREQNGQQPWEVVSVAGEQLIDLLKNENPEGILLVIPAGQSTKLDSVFTSEETTFLKEEFFNKGGRGFFTCGSAYWVSDERIYKDLCEVQPDKRDPIIKKSKLSLFQGLAEGPLCPFPGKKYQVGFYSDAIDISDGKNECTIFLSGGGSFIPREETDQKIRILARYVHSELMRTGKTKEECQKWENAAIMVSTGKGAAILSMFHPYYNEKDTDIAVYEEVFPFLDCGTNWREVHSRLSPLDIRMHFVFYSMLSKLESMDFGNN